MSQEDTPTEAPEAEVTVTTSSLPEPKPQGKTFDEDYVKSLRSENAAHRKRAQEAEERLQALEERDQSEVQKAQGKLTRAEQRAAEAEAKLLRYEVAQEKEVPAKLVPLLTATDKESLEAQADLILENAKPEDPDFDGGARVPAPEPETPEEAHNKTFLAALGLTPNT